MADPEKPRLGPREWTRVVIFGTDTPVGKIFDVVLIIAILASVLAVMLASIESVRAEYLGVLRIAEWAFTVIFTIEYLVRLWSAESARRYSLSFFGVVDLLAILPTYLSLLVPGAEYLLMVRILRVLRIFRVLKLLHYVSGSNIIIRALIASRHKIAVFLATVLVLVCLAGAFMYLVEGEESGFDNIPVSIYWTVVTLTTVGYGDLTPITPMGRFLASGLMLLGYAVIAVPTGIVTAELAKPFVTGIDATRTCPHCAHVGHPADAEYCHQCGGGLRRVG